MRFPLVLSGRFARTPLAGALVLTLCAALACGGEDVEAKLERAGRALSEARADVEKLRERVQEAKAETDAAEGELEKARKELREAEQRLAEVEQKVDLRATDAALFRTIQSRLLEDKSLQRVAIAARVEKGVVVLSGSVPKPELRERALSIARTTPGVSAVESRIEVVGEAAKPGAASD